MQAFLSFSPKIAYISYIFPQSTPILSLPPVESRVVNVKFTEPEREFYNALLEKSQDIFEGFISSGTASKSWLAIFSLLHRLRSACGHIALTVKSHIDETEWNVAAARDGTELISKARTPNKPGQNSASVDDAVSLKLLPRPFISYDDSLALSEVHHWSPSEVS